MPTLPCIFYTLNWLTLTCKTHFAHFYLMVFIFSRWAKTSIWHWEWGCYENTYENQNWYTKIGTFSAITSKVKWIWSWNFGVIMRKLWSFIWHQKSTASSWALGDENVIGVRTFDWIPCMEILSKPRVCHLWSNLSENNFDIGLFKFSYLILFWRNNLCNQIFQFDKTSQ